MSIDRSTAIVRALGVPDPRLVDSDSLWTTETTWPEQNPRAGHPVDQGDSDVVLAAYGSRATTSTIELESVSAGAIDPITGAGFAWKKTGDALYRGRNAPTSIWGWNAIHYTDGSSTVTGAVTASKAPHTVTTAKRTVLVTSQVTRYNTGETVQVSRWVESSQSWSTANVRTTTPAPSQAFEPALCVIPRTTGDRVLVFYWLEDTDTDTIQLAMSYSDDEGATWLVGSSACLKTPLFSGETACRRIRAAYRNGQVVLFAHLVGQSVSDAAASNDHIRQWGSYDNGATFFDVTSGQGTSSLEGAFPDVVATPSGFVMCFVSIDRAGSKIEPYIQQRIVPDAFFPFGASPLYRGINTSVEPSTGVLVGYLQVANGDLGSGEIRHVPATGTVASSKYTYADNDLSLVASDDGTLYLITSALSSYVNFSGGSTVTHAKNEVVAVRSVDSGLNWETMGISDIFPVQRQFGRPRENFPGSATIWRGQDTGSYLRSYAGTWWKGQIVLAHQWLAATANEDSSLCAAWLGGYSTLNMPRTELARDESTLAAWINTWLPIERPGDLTAWTATGSATELLILASVRITASSGFRKYANTDAATGYIVRASLTTTSTTTLVNTRVAISMRTAVSVTHRQVEVRFSTSKIRLYDVVAGAVIGSDVSIDTTAGVDVIASLQDGVAALWYRPKGASEDLEYIAGPTGAATAGGASTDEVAWGVLSSDTATVRWHEFHATSGVYAGQTLETLQSMTNPSDLNAVRYSPTGTYLTDGVVVAARSGPALEGDSHHIALASDYPISRVFPSVFPSPRRGTRTVDDNSEVKIAVAFDSKASGGGWESAPLSDSMCLAVLGANWRTGFVERYDRGTSSWVTLVTIDAASGMSWLANSWTRTGATIRADGSLGALATQLYLEPNELAGGTLEFSSSKLRKIAANTEGNTRGTLSGRQATVRFDGADNTETTSTVRFWSPNFVAWWNMLGETAQGFRLRIPAQDTVDGDIRVGTLVWGNIHAFGTPYSFGRALGQEHGVQVVQAEDRTYRTRTLAPSRRSVTISWSDGVPTCNASGESPDPDYVKLSDSSGALPVASSFDLPMTLRGLSEQINGPALPVVYLPRLEKGPPNATTLNRRRDFLVGVLDSDIQLDTVQGAENEDEFIRVASLRIREIV